MTNNEAIKLDFKNGLIATIVSYFTSWRKNSRPGPEGLLTTLHSFAKPAAQGWPASTPPLLCDVKPIAICMKYVVQLIWVKTESHLRSDRARTEKYYSARWKWSCPPRVSTSSRWKASKRNALERFTVFSLHCSCCKRIKRASNVCILKARPQEYGFVSETLNNSNVLFIYYIYSNFQ